MYNECMPSSSLFNDTQRRFAETVSQLIYCNPFLPERVELEKRALGKAFVAEQADWNVRSLDRGPVPNVESLISQCETLIEAARPNDFSVARQDVDWELYEDVVLFVLYHRYHERMTQTFERGVSGTQKVRLSYYPRFAEAFERYLGPHDEHSPAGLTAEHAMAFCFQVRRAFLLTFRHLIGASQPTVRLRAAIWQSIFTHDMRRYRRSLYHQMGEITTLITGPSGSGKEVVARAIGRSRYIPFNAKATRFTEDFAGSFHALNVSALAPTLVESELFGHRRGAFTGAVGDRVGWLETCPPLGTVFLDEIGDLDPAIQVKLLRVLQERRFQRMGETTDRAFAGKIIAATNRDLHGAMEADAFRSDFYYRLCADRLQTYRLREQLNDRPDDLIDLVQHIAKRMVGPEESASLADEVVDWVGKRMPRDYDWPGNVRELEQCVRNILIRNAYEPQAGRETRRASLPDWLNPLLAGSMTADALLDRYCALVYDQAGSYGAAARSLGLDRRTVKARASRAEPDH